MKLITIGSRVFELPESWDELKLKHYINLVKLEEQRKDFLIPELYLLRLIEVLCDSEEGGMDDLPLDEIEPISQTLTFVQKSAPEFSSEKHFEIDGVLYSSPLDFTKLSMGEFISIKTYQEGAASIWDAAPWILAILWRPTEKVFDEERKEEILKREPFKVENLEWRKNLLLNTPATKILGALLFFLTLSPSFKKSSVESSPKNQKEMELIGDPATTS